MKPTVWRNLKPALAAGSAGCLAFTLSALLILAAPDDAKAGKAQAAVPPSDMQRITYEVYAGGVNAVSAVLDVNAPQSSHYGLSLSASTKGFLRTLAPWDGTFETRGWQMKEHDQPELHRSTAVWRDEEEIKEYSYSKDGKFVGYSVIDPENTGKQDLPAAELTTGTTDVLTATLDVMKEIAAGEACNTRAEVFDGKRRFAMQFTLEAEEDLKATRYNVYEGPSQRCVVEVVPVAGEWHKKPRGWMSLQEQGRVQGKLPTVWFAKVSPDRPAVPVKIRVTSDYGTLFMHMVAYDDGTTNLVQLDD